MKRLSDLRATLLTCLIFVIPVCILLFGSIIVSVDTLREPLERFVLCRCSDDSDFTFRYSDGGSVRDIKNLNKEKNTKIVQLACKDCDGNEKVYENDTVAVTGIIASFSAGAVPGLLLSLLMIISSIRKNSVKKKI